MDKTIEKIANRNPKRQDSKPMLFEEWHPLPPIRKSFMFYKFAKEDVAPDGAQSKSYWVKNQPEDDICGCYFRPVLLSLVVICITYHKLAYMCIIDL